MSLPCNNSARGKKVRLINGIVATLIGIVLLLAWAIPSGAVLAWIVTGLILVAGGFSIFEARAGWCALRAMGMKTPI
jgi:uncharacterized membrane protein HdeD (DUF308 family)